MQKRFFYRAIVVNFLLIMVLGLTTTAQETNKIVYGLTLSVSGIDPHINQSSELGIVLRQVYDTLVYRDPITKDIVSGLAESWFMSDDGLSYTFSLKRNVTFHDGTAFNAQAVAANLDRITDPALSSQKAKGLLGSFASYEIVDEYTIRLNLSTPYSPFLDGLSQVYLGMASPTALSAYSTDPLLYQFHQIGTGPFIFVEYLPEDHITLRRNPDYAWAPAFYGTLPENAIEEIEFRWYTDPATRAIALESGEVQVIGELLPLDAQAISNNSAITLAPVAIPGQPLQFYMNTKKAPTDRVEFRQALIYGANRNAIVESVFQGFSPLAWGALSVPTQFYDNQVVGLYNYDTLKAQELLAGLGYQDTDADGILELNGEPLKIKVIQPPWGLVPPVTQLLQDQWRGIGIQVEVIAVPGFTALLDQVKTGDYNLVEFESYGLDPAFLNNRFLSTGTSNWTGYSDNTLDSLLLQAVQTSDATARATLYSQAQTIIMQQALILPIRDIVNVNAYQSTLQGLQFDPYGWFPLLYGVSQSNS